MMEHIVEVIFSQYGLVGLGLIAMAAALYKIMDYYMNKIIPQQQEERSQDRKERKEQLDLLKTSVNKQDVVQQQMLETMKDLSRSFVEINNKVATHDEKSNAILSSIVNQGVAISNIAERVATTDSIGRVHDRIDEEAKIMAGLDEKVSGMGDRICDLEAGTDKIYQTVNEIKILIPTICKSRD